MLRSIGGPKCHRAFHNGLNRRPYYGTINKPIWDPLIRPKIRALFEGLGGVAHVGGVGTLDSDDLKDLQSCFWVVG